MEDATIGAVCLLSILGLVAVLLHEFEEDQKARKREKKLRLLRQLVAVNQIEDMRRSSRQRTMVSNRVDFCFLEICSIVAF